MSSLVSGEFPGMSGFWQLPFWAVFLITTSASPVFVWLVEVVRSKFDKRRPFGGGIIFKWTMVWLGDPLLAVAVTITAAYYQRVEVGHSVYNGLGFTGICAFIAALFLAGYLMFEHKEGAIPKEDIVSFGRFYHSSLVLWEAYMFVGAVVRMAAFRQNAVLIALFLTMLAGYALTHVAYRLGWDPLSNAIRKHWPGI